VNATPRLSWLLVAIVSLYLVGVGTWLILTRQIPAPGFTRILRALLRPAYSGALTSFTPERGCCFLAPLPQGLLSDRDSASSLRVYEDGKAMGPAHASHAEIRESGAGRYSHWGDQLYFSASDNSDPRTNGRQYTVREVR